VATDDRISHAVAIPSELTGARNGGLVIVCGAARRSGLMDDLPLLVRNAIASEHAIDVDRVIVVPRRSLPFTTSGKPRRRVLAAELAVDRVDILVEEAWEALGTRPPSPPRGAGAEATAAGIEQWLIDRIATVRRVAAAEVSVTTPFTDQGLDSLQMVELIEDLSIYLDLGLDHTLCWDYPTISAVADWVGLDPATGTRDAITVGAATVERSVIDDASRHFYTDLTKDQDRALTNQHYQVPARFLEVMTGGRWNVYSCNVWEGIEHPSAGNAEHQTAAQEAKLDIFAELLELKPGMRVLDVGSGYGGPLLYLADRYGVRGHGVTLSQNQIDRSTARARREGLDCTFEVRHWQDLAELGSFDAIMNDEAIVHFYDLEGFFRLCGELLVDDGVLVNKELHFTHPGFGFELDPFSAFVNDVFGGTGNYRALSDELVMTNRAGLLIEDVRQILNSNYLLTASSWYRNLRAHEAEMIELVGTETFARFLKYVSWVMVGPGGQSVGSSPLQVHFVKCRKPNARVRDRLGDNLYPTSELEQLLDAIEADTGDELARNPKRSTL